MDPPEPEAFHPGVWTPNRICLEPTRKRRFRQARKFRSASTRRIRRATTATLLLDAREPVESVQDLLDRKHITTTQIMTNGGGQ
jgi:site-specific recombinase XerC